MEDRMITLSFHRKGGRLEEAKLKDYSLVEAHEAAERVLDAANGIYTEVDICTEDGCVETLYRVDTVGATSSKVCSIRIQ
jgi:hypothetical protein